MNDRSQALQLSALSMKPELANSTRIPFKHEPDVVGNEVAFIVVVLLLALLASWLWLRKRQGGHQASGRRCARVLESHRLGPRSTLMVVEFAGQWHLLAENERSVTCIAQAPAGDKQ